MATFPPSRYPVEWTWIKGQPTSAISGIFFKDFNLGDLWILIVPGELQEQGQVKYRGSRLNVHSVTSINTPLVESIVNYLENSLFIRTSLVHHVELSFERRLRCDLRSSPDSIWSLFTVCHRLANGLDQFPYVEIISYR